MGRPFGFAAESVLFDLALAVVPFSLGLAAPFCLTALPFLRDAVVTPLLTASDGEDCLLSLRIRGRRFFSAPPADVFAAAVARGADSAPVVCAPHSIQNFASCGSETLHELQLDVLVKLTPSSRRVSGLGCIFLIIMAFVVCRLCEESAGEIVMNL